MATTTLLGKRDELLELLREEWRQGCANRVGGGMGKLVDAYKHVMPPEAVSTLLRYSALDTQGRRNALRLASDFLKNPPAPSAERTARRVYAEDDGDDEAVRSLTALYGGSSERVPLPRPHVSIETRPAPPAPGTAEGAPARPVQKPKPAPFPIKPIDPDAEVTYLKGVGPKNATLLEKVGVRTVRDLLYLVPHRWDDYSALACIADLTLGDEVTVVGEVRRVAEVTTSSGKSRTIASLADDTGAITLTWFTPYVARQMHVGDIITVSGTVTEFGGAAQFSGPEWERIEPGADLGSRILPVYPLTEGLYQKSVRNAVRHALAATAGQIADWLPEDVRDAEGLLPLEQALRWFHTPEAADELRAAKRRLSFDEYLLMQLGMLKRKETWKADAPGPPLPADSDTLTRFRAALPFSFTGAQDRALDAILADIAQDVPMRRLVQGDVGSGKTVVAAAAMYVAFADGHQSALMAPTEILAEQHHRTLSKLFAQFPKECRPHVELLTGSTRKTHRTPILDGLSRNIVHILVGTHALIEDPVIFDRLGLTVVDEQHRFGVGQRARLRAKGNGVAPHMLVMTATPIPRSLALTLHGDLDVSTIDELPPGRTPVATFIVPGAERERAYEAVRDAVANGNQAFIICPLVEESETVEAKAAVAEHERLQRDVFPDLSLGLLHGKMAPRKKNEVMTAFRAREHDALVATSVVEVGIDVPNATLMVIEGADRFGLSQLHQFRGRVGRGADASTCLLIPDDISKRGAERLGVMEETNDGFVIAQADLEMRGPGDLFGTQQSGYELPLKVASLGDTRDLDRARVAAENLLAADPHLMRPEHAPLAARLESFWSHSAGAGDLS